MCFKLGETHFFLLSLLFEMMNVFESHSDEVKHIEPGKTNAHYVRTISNKEACHSGEETLSST